MSFLMILRVAVKALNRNKMRTALTMLGMIIGVAAVITMVALGTGAQTSIEAQIQSAGTNMIMVSAGNFQQGGVRMGQGNASTLTPEDAQAIREVPGVQYVAAGVNTRGQLVAGNMNWGTQVQGSDVVQTPNVAMYGEADWSGFLRKGNYPSADAAMQAALNKRETK